MEECLLIRMLYCLDITHFVFLSESTPLKSRNKARFISYNKLLQSSVYKPNSQQQQLVQPTRCHHYYDSHVYQNDSDNNS